MIHLSKVSVLLKGILRGSHCRTTVDQNEQRTTFYTLTKLYFRKILLLLLQQTCVCVCCVCVNVYSTTKRSIKKKPKGSLYVFKRFIFRKSWTISFIFFCFNKARFAKFNCFKHAKEHFYFLNPNAYHKILNKINNSKIIREHIK